MTMRYGVLVITIIVFFIIGLGVLYIKPFYTPAERQNGLITLSHDDDTVRVAYIGDSWAEGYKKVNCMIDSLVNYATGKPVLVRIAGISGLTSKNVYYGLFRNESMRRAIEWGPDYCFVVAGINDSDRKMGKGYYKENMRLIIELLLDKGIMPIVLEIPSYDIDFSYKRRNRIIKLQYLVSMILTRSKMNCIEEYRNEYRIMLEEQSWADKVITIFNDEWNPDGYKDTRTLYDSGRMHLNEIGYHVLDTCIAHKIINHINNLSNEGYSE